MIIESVAEFHRAFSLPYNEEFIEPDSNLKELRINLLKEEYDELREAHQENDIVEVADALADIAYIAAGTLWSYGLSLNNGWAPVSNIEIEKKPHLPEVTVNKLEIIDIIFNTYLLNEKHNYYEGVRTTLYALIDEVVALANICNIPFYEVFKEVQRSNMAKLMPDGSVRRREDNKILKPDGWVPPDIKSIIFK